MSVAIAHPATATVAAIATHRIARPPAYSGMLRRDDAATQSDLTCRQLSSLSSPQPSLSLRLRLGAGGEVTMEAAAAPPPQMVEELGRHRVKVARILAERDARAAWSGRGSDGPLTVLQAPDPERDAEQGDNR